MVWTIRAGAALWAALGLATALANPLNTAAAVSAHKDFDTLRPSADARYVAQWALGSGDHDGQPFVIVDKNDARVYVFRGDGRLAGSTAALLGSTRGDHSVPGVGERTQTGSVGVDERTTPAGRFVTTPGRNLQGEHVVWVDYQAAFAIHRLRPGASFERRQARLSSASAADKRVSLGCVVVPVAFYESVVEPLLGRKRGVVYVLPETQPVQEVFGAM